MSEHAWVKMVITPIHVVDDPEVSSEPVILVTEVDQEEAEECAQYGCSRCDAALNSDSFRTMCAGEPEIDIIAVDEAPHEKP